MRLFCGKMALGVYSAFAAERRDMLHDMHESGNKAWGEYGVAINQMRSLKASYFCGEKFDGNVNVIFARNKEHLASLWAYCSSDEYNENVRRIDQKLNVTNATLLKVPFDLEQWKQVANSDYPNGLPKPYTNDPTNGSSTATPAPQSCGTKPANGPKRAGAL